MLFASHGYDAIGVQEIADQAGVTKPTLYHYFINKRGLLTSLLERSFTPLLGELENATAYHHDITLSLENVTRTYFKFALQDPRFYRLQLAMTFAPDQSDSYRAITPFSKKQTYLIEKLFLDASKDHGNMIGRAPQYAATLLGMVNTYIALALDKQQELDEQLIYQALHQFMHGIFS